MEQQNQQAMPPDGKNKKKKGFLAGCLGCLGMIILFGIIIGACAGGMTSEEKTPVSSDVSKDQEETTAAEAPEEATDNATQETEAPQEEVTEPEEEPAEKTTEIKAGTYKVGTDLPPGEYLVFSDGMAYFEASKDSTGTLDSIIFNDNLTGGTAYVTLQDGQYFKLQRGKMYPVDQAPSIIPENGIYETGMFKVGKDIPAGEYKVILDSTIGMGYIEVASDSSHQLGSIISNDIVESDQYITVSDGQYLKLQDVKIEK